MSHLAREATIRCYQAAAEARIADVYDAVATLVDVRRDEIAFVEGATRAWDMVLYAAPYRAGEPRHHHAGRIPFELSRIPADEGARGDLIGGLTNPD